MYDIELVRLSLLKIETAINRILERAETIFSYHLIIYKIYNSLGLSPSLPPPASGLG